MARTRRLHLAPDLALPLDAVTRTFGIFGQRGTGKSTTGAVLVEQAVRAGGRSVVLDPTGVWYGLTREGSKPGLPGVVLGGEHADAPLEPGGGRIVAEFVIGSDYPLVILDMKLLRKHQRQHFAMELLEALYHENREPLMVVFDEGAQFAPTHMREGGDVPRLLGAVEDVVKLGRSRGLGAVMIEQRIATLNANVREQIETLVAHRLVGPLDRKALREWVAAQGEPDREAEALGVIAKLKPGTALVWSPSFLEFFGQVKINNATTFDSRATPKVGTRRPTLGARAPVDLDSLREKMATVIEEQQANDPKALRERARSLQKMLDSERAAVAEWEARWEARAPETQVVEVPVVTEEQVEAIRSLVVDIGDYQEDLVARYEALREVLVPIGLNLKDALQRRDFPKPPPAPSPRPVSSAAPRSPDTRRRAVEVEDGGSSNGAVTNPEQRVLDAVAWYEAVGVGAPTRPQVAVVAGYRFTSGGFKNLLGALKTKGLVSYPSDGLVAFTAAGRGLAREPDFPPTTEHLHEAVQARLARPQWRVMAPVLAAFPSAVSREVIARVSGYEITSGGFKNILGGLRTLNLIEYPEPGYVVALDWLFPTGSA